MADIFNGVYGSVFGTVYGAAQSSTLDSSLSVSNVDRLIIYGSAANADTNTNPGPAVTSSLSFAFGSTVSGVVMGGTLYVRAVIGAQTILTSLAIVQGANVLDLGVLGQLAALTAKTLTLAQIEASRVLALKADVWGAA